MEPTDKMIEAGILKYVISSPFDICPPSATVRDIWNAMEAARDDGWRPIADAPGDGTVVDLWITGQDSMVDFYAPEAVKIAGKPIRHGRTTSYRWEQRGSNRPNWYPISGMGYPLSPEVTPTHWMPLPAPPEDTATEKDDTWNQHGYDPTGPEAGAGFRPPEDTQ